MRDESNTYGVWKRVLISKLNRGYIFNVSSRKCHYFLIKLVCKASYLSTGNGNKMLFQTYNLFFSLSLWYKIQLKPCLSLNNYVINHTSNYNYKFYNRSNLHSRRLYLQKISIGFYFFFLLVSYVYNMAQQNLEATSQIPSL